MGICRAMRLMSPLLVAGLVLAVFCNVISAAEEGNAEVHPIDLGESSEANSEAYKAKKLLQVPGIPKWAKVSRSVDGVSSDACKNACDAGKTCTGFQYVAAER